MLKLLNALDEKINECVALCSSPTKHPKLLDIVRELCDRCRRVRMLVPFTEALLVPRKVVELLDELCIVSYVADPRTVEALEKLFRILTSSGFDNLATYLVIDENALEIEKPIEVARSYGVRVRVGEAPYVSPRHLDVVKLLTRKGISIGLPYGDLYGYRACVAFVDGYPITVLFKDFERCSYLYLDPAATLRRCAFSSKYVDLKSCTNIEESLRNLVRECVHRASDAIMKPVVRIDIRVGDKIVPSEILQILDIVELVGSVRKACTFLGISLSTCIDKIRRIENELGTQLIETRRGGRDHGKTTLTPLAMKILESYRTTREKILRILSEEIVL